MAINNTSLFGLDTKQKYSFLRVVEYLTDKRTEGVTSFPIIPASLLLGFDVEESRSLIQYFRKLWESDELSPADIDASTLSPGFGVTDSHTILNVSQAVTEVVWGGLSLLSLFSGGEQGAWYDPSDLSTLFQDAAGTTPAALDLPVGLMLDKRLGLVRGPELVVNGGFDSASNWVTAGPWSVSGGRANTSGGSTGYVEQPVALGVAGKWYEIAFDYSITSSAIQAKFGGTVLPVVSVGSGRKHAIIQANGTGNLWLMVFSNSAVGWIDNVSVREIPGNHASQSTAAARPVLSARKNLITHTDDLDSSVWIGSAAGTGVMPILTKNYGEAPDGTMTAHRLQLDSGAAGNSQFTHTGATGGQTGATFTASLWMRSLAGPVDVTLFNNNTAPAMSVTEQWQRFEVPYTTVNNNVDMRIAKRDVWATSGAADILVWHPQYELSPTATRYQRVTTATDYDAQGFPLKCDYDTVDDALATTFAAPLGSNCTIARATPGVGAQILTAQTIGTTFSDTTDSHGLLILDRALTAPETAVVIRWCAGRAGL